MDAFAHGPLGSDHRSSYCALVRANHERKAASRDGLSRLPGHHTTGREVFGAARGSGGRACVAHRRVPLQEHRIDPEKLSRPGAAATVVAVTIGSTAAARQHPRCRVLRIGAPMLQEPMMEKLTAMRLLGMTDALKAQEQDPASRELSFLERLGLLVDHQWNWRENQALARRLYTAKPKGGACVEEIDYRTSRGLDKSVIRALAQKSAWVVNHENIFVLR